MDGERRSSSITIWAVRIAALAIALALLWWSVRMEGEFRIQTAARFAFDWGWFWRIQAVNVVAGIAFVVAVRFPFSRPRFAWGRLVIAGLVFLPVVHVWFSFSVTSGPEFLRRFYWFDNVSSMVWSILAGVAIGAGFGARRAAGETIPEASGG
jgi:hypothetical protein